MVQKFMTHRITWWSFGLPAAAVVIVALT